jgi:signal transduction histidine kinase/CheY-like chemotaxis protein
VTDVSLPETAVRVLHALPEAAIYITTHGDVLAANRLARAALGVAGRADERPLKRLPVEDAAALTDTLRQWGRSTTPTPGSFTAATPSGSEPFSARGSVIVARAGEQPAVLLVRFSPRRTSNPFVLLNRKVTELHDEVARRVQVEDALRRSEAALQERVTEAEALNRAKDEFLATVSHELRTPLNAILGWASLLRLRAPDDQTAKALEVIHRNAVSQARLIDDILDVSWIITGKMRLETRPCDLAALVEEAVEVVRPSAEARQITLTVDRPLDACRLVADPDRIRQVAWNLLSNAVKFTERQGAVHVRIAQDGSQFVLDVDDTGTGIDPAFLPFVFDRFKQADSSTTRRAGGLGLGLALVRHIVELHGGSVNAQSDGLGRGASFSVALPIRAVVEIPEPFGHEITPEAEPLPAELRELDGLRVLVVDDEPDARELLALLLTQAGGEVTTAASAAEALDALTRQRTDVLVSDIGMPGENGYALMRRVRSETPPGVREIPSVALTAYTRREDRLAALDAGFTAHIGKPVRPGDLIATVVTLAPPRSAPG